VLVRVDAERDLAVLSLDRRVRGPPFQKQRLRAREKENINPLVGNATLQPSSISADSRKCLCGPPTPLLVVYSRADNRVRGASFQEQRLTTEESCWFRSGIHARLAVS
jgi:hypothetical protein